MIIEGICNIFFGVAYFLLSMLPRFPSFENINVSLSPVFWVIRFVNLFISVKTVSACLLLILVIYNIKFIWSVFMWLIRKIPGVS